MSLKTKDPLNPKLLQPESWNMALGGFVLGSLIIFLNGMRRTMFQLSGFYFKPTQDLWFGPGVGGGCSGELCSVFRVEGLGFSQSEFCWKFGAILVLAFSDRSITQTYYHTPCSGFGRKKMTRSC